MISNWEWDRDLQRALLGPLGRDAVRAVAFGRSALEGHLNSEVLGRYLAMAELSILVGETLSSDSFHFLEALEVNDIGLVRTWRSGGPPEIGPWCRDGGLLARSYRTRLARVEGLHRTENLQLEEAFDGSWSREWIGTFERLVLLVRDLHDPRATSGIVLHGHEPSAFQDAARADAGLRFARALAAALREIGDPRQRAVAWSVFWKLDDGPESLFQWLADQLDEAENVHEHGSEVGELGVDALEALSVAREDLQQVRRERHSTALSAFG